MNNEEECSICGDLLSTKFTIKLSCNHTYHYECIMKTFQTNQYTKSYNRKCPLCNGKTDLLPMVNGLKAPLKGIHYILEYPHDFQNQTCQHIMQRGKRKGETCNKNCILGYHFCGYHNKNTLKN
tara:strand:- start:81 stop:452 length:372 start_codon:yes stop_codon:yes gene_type:complete